MIRLAEALAALSLATDAGNGHPLEKSLRNAVIAARFGEALGLRGQELSDVYYVALLRSIGCTAYAHETAALLGGDDVAFHTLYEQLDPGHPVEFAREVVTGMGAWASPAIRARSVARFFTVGPKNGREAGRSACEVSESLARRLELPAGVREGLDQVYERWDGKGIPDGIAGTALCLPARVTHIVDIAEIVHRDRGAEAARAVMRRRAGGHFDPELAEVFAREAARSSPASRPTTPWPPSRRRTPASRAPTCTASRALSPTSSTSSRRGPSATPPPSPRSQARTSSCRRCCTTSGASPYRTVSGTSRGR